MEFKKWILQEMPITNFQLKGNWNGPRPMYGFNDKDQGILQNPKAVEKIHKHWSNSQENFEFYFLRSKLAYKHVEVGEVTPQWVEENLGVQILPKEDAITVIFTNNTGDNKVPMTAWIIAHRLGHAIRRDKQWENNITNEITRVFRDICKNVYRLPIQPYNDYENYKYYNALAMALGTMKSATNHKLIRFGEFAHELLAQYITTGQIKFNPLPRSLITRRRMAWGRPNDETRSSHHLDDADFTDYNYAVETLASTLEYYFSELLSQCNGKLFVM